MRCAVYGCNTNNRSTNNFKFFGFPKDENMKAKWKHLCKRKDKFNVKNARICSKHFVDEDYERNLKHELLGYQPKRFRSLKKEAVPSKNLPILKGIDLAGIATSTDNGDGGTLNNNGNSNISDGFSTEDAESSSFRSVGTNTDSEVDDRDEIIRRLQERIKVLEHRQIGFENYLQDIPRKPKCSRSSQTKSE
ncbi:hypothetical protein NQ318_015884 [Aromia moschata]|uniref:THAP-type domain-containing protein n=1 Tax=Aromia moschata TaxID=1265417 RepID=A0AAV8XZT2_9CUCU|nr:hypothetical protein NQ318_015884 [Aromia moschata]